MTGREIDEKTKRLKILEPDEIETLYGLPVFDDEDREFRFALLPSEKAALSQLHSVKSRLYFVLQLGYFKERYQFFILAFRTSWKMLATFSKLTSLISSLLILLWRKVPA